MSKHLILLGIVVFLSVFSAFAQEEEEAEKLSYHSFSVSPVGFYIGENTGFAFNADVSFASGLNIFSLGFGAASEITIMGSKNSDYYQANLLYGRAFQIAKWMACDLYVGIGYFGLNTYESTYTTKWETERINYRTVGFPIGTKLRFGSGPKFSMGLQLQANINSAETIGTMGLVLQWNKTRD